MTELTPSVVVGLAASNAAVAALLALAVAAVEPRLRRPVVVHASWALVLARLLMPPVLAFGVLPARTAEPLSAAARPAVATGLVGVAGEVVGSYRPGAAGAALLTWLVGLAVVALMAWVRTRRFRRVLAGAHPVAPAVEGIVAEVARRLGIDRPPRAVGVGAVVPPMLWAPLGRPVVVLPDLLLDRLDRGETEALVAHELAHVRRRDHWMRYLELAVVALFWWCPVAWWASRRLRRAEERCCDEVVASSLPEHRRSYAECLLKTMSFLAASRGPRLALGSAVARTDELKGRLTMIMTRRPSNALAAPLRLSLLAVAIAVLAVTPLLASRADAPASDRRSGTAATAPEVSDQTGTADHTGEPITLRLEGARLDDVLATFAELTELNIVIDREVRELGLDQKPVTIYMKDRPWDEVLEQLLRENGMGWRLVGNVLWVQPLSTSAEESRFSGEPITLRLEQAEVRDVLSKLCQLTGLGLELDPRVAGAVDVNLREVPWDQALDLILKQSDLVATVDGGVLKVFPAR